MILVRLSQVTQILSAGYVECRMKEQEEMQSQFDQEVAYDNWYTSGKSGGILFTNAHNEDYCRKAVFGNNFTRTNNQALGIAACTSPRTFGTTASPSNASPLGLQRSTSTTIGVPTTWC